MCNYLKISIVLFVLIGCKTMKSDKAQNNIGLEGQFYITQIQAGEYLDFFDNKEYVCVFKDSSISAYIGCNRIGGSYSVENDILKIGPLFSTKMYCKEKATQEIKLINALELAKEVVKEDNIVLLKGSESHTITLIKIP